MTETGYSVKCKNQPPDNEQLFNPSAILEEALRVNIRLHLQAGGYFNRPQPFRQVFLQGDGFARFNEEAAAVLAP